jgi:hypothetical protein
VLGHHFFNAYEELIESQHPWFGNVDCFAMLGGWSLAFLWCDHDYPWHVFDKALTVLTLHGSEPWIEVFDDGQSFEGYSRIT